MHETKVVRFFFLKFVNFLQTNAHGGENSDVVMFCSLLTSIAIMSSNSSLFICWDLFKKADRKKSSW